MLGALLLIVAVSVGALFYFSSSEVQVIPLSRAVSITDASFAGTGNAGALPFEVITVEKVASQTVASTGTKAVSSSAQGTITVYNTQSGSQRLIANTRFETPGGLVFRIKTQVTVPGAKGGTPGSATATIYADKPGSEYNVGPTTFTLPGLASSPLFTAVTAKSTSAMSGGASGNEPIIASETEKATRTALMNSLETELATELGARVPEGYVLLPGAADTEYAPLASTPGPEAGTAEVKEKGMVRGVIFAESALAKALAESALLSDYKGEPLVLTDGHTLALKAKSIPTDAEKEFSFTLSGTATLAYVVDPMRIAAAIAGKTRSAATDVLKQYPEVKEATLTLRPFWRTSYPDDPMGITVGVSSPAGAN